MARFLVVRVYCVILMHALFVCVHCEFPTSNKNYSKKTNTHAISQPRHVTYSSSFSLLFRMERIWIGLFCLRTYTRIQCSHFLKHLLYSHNPVSATFPVNGFQCEKNKIVRPALFMWYQHHHHHIVHSIMLSMCKDLISVYMAWGGLGGGVYVLWRWVLMKFNKENETKLYDNCICGLRLSVT